MSPQQNKGTAATAAAAAPAPTTRTSSANAIRNTWWRRGRRRRSRRSAPTSSPSLFPRRRALQIVKTIKPPAALGLQVAMAMAGTGTEAFNTASSSLVVAKMATDRAELLKTQGSGRCSSSTTRR